MGRMKAVRNDDVQGQTEEDTAPADERQGAMTDGQGQASQDESGATCADEISTDGLIHRGQGRGAYVDT